MMSLSLSRSLSQSLRFTRRLTRESLPQSESSQSRYFSSNTNTNTSFHDLYTEDHEAIARSLRTFIDREINPYVSQWEKDEIWPGKELTRKMGQAGFLGLTKPVEYGGSGLDYSYSMMMSEEMGTVNCGGLPMAIGVCVKTISKLYMMHRCLIILYHYLGPIVHSLFKSMMN
jgi:alkylation response protein AidB-like acyl-CoA dehydrogenase